jgi:hypothetical protein
MTTTRSLRHASARLLATLALACGAVAATGAGCGAEDGVVGGDCASGYTQCDLSCFDLETDPAHCGACGNACAPGVACVSGSCDEGSLDATAEDEDGETFDGSDLVVDGEICNVTDPAHPVCRPIPEADAPPGSDGGDGAPAGDGSTDGSGNEGGGSGDASGGGDDGGQGGDGAIGGDGGTSDGCAPPFDTPQSCGGCGNACVAPNDVCTLVDGGFQCAPTCAPPLVDCAGHCVNVTRDPGNCGACGTVCPSQYCYLATCQGSVAGNVMVIGHDFQVAKAADEETKLLTNSVFYNSGAVTLLSFEHYADPPTVANALAILHAYATVPFTVQPLQDDTSLASDALLAGANVVIVWDQPNAPAGKLGALGSAWAPHLSAYVQGGGTVIALDADQGIGEMPALVTNAALLAVTGHGSVTPGSPVDVPYFGLSIARGMTSVYAVEKDSAWFSTSEAASLKTLFVANVQGQTGELIAVHKVIN